MDFITADGVPGTVQRRERFTEKYKAMVDDDESDWYDERCAHTPPG
jgi:hypothetical protein